MWKEQYVDVEGAGADQSATKGYARGHVRLYNIYKYAHVCTHTYRHVCSYMHLLSVCVHFVHDAHVSFKTLQGYLSLPYMYTNMYIA